MTSRTGSAPVAGRTEGRTIGRTPGRTTALILLALAATTSVLAAAATAAGPTEFGEPRWGLLAGVEQTPEVVADAGAEDPASARAADDGEQQGLLPGWSLSVVVLVVSVLVALAVRSVMNADPRDGPDQAPAPRPAGAGDDAEDLLVSLRRAAASAAASPPRSGDPADDVVRAWCALEEAAAGAGTRRDAAQTPTEFTGDLLLRHDADPQATAELLGLYHRARFSAQSLPSEAQATARRALGRIAESLGSRG